MKWNFPIFNIKKYLASDIAEQLYTQKHLQREDVDYLVCTDWGYMLLDELDKNYSIENLTDRRFEDENYLV